MKTAVEWIFNQLLGDRILSKELMELIDQAKEMEKEQIQRAFVASKMTLKNEEQYYNETFKSE